MFRQSECLTGLEVFSKTGGKLEMSYDDMKTKLPDANIVNYYDLKKLYKEGKYTPDNIDKALHIWIINHLI